MLQFTFTNHVAALTCSLSIKYVNEWSNEESHMLTTTHWLGHMAPTLKKIFFKNKAAMKGLLNDTMEEPLLVP